MQTVLCFEVLFATILLWVAIFGVMEELMQQFGKSNYKLLFYCLLGFFVTCWVYEKQHISFCTLM